MLDALRVRDFRLTWGGTVISAAGSWLLVIAVPAHVFTVTRSLGATGLTLAAGYLPVLVLGPAAGVLADRLDRRRLLIGASLARAAAVGGMLAGLGPHGYPVLYAALAAESAGSVLAAPAAQARIPDLVGTGPLLSSATALNAAGSGIVALAGGPLGGILLAAVGIRVLICADVASYLIAAGAVALTARPARAAVGQGTLAGAGRGLRAGLGVLAATPAARGLLPVTVTFLAANAALTAIVVPFGLERLGGSRGTGLMYAALGAGYLLGAPALRAALDRAAPRTLLAAALAGQAAAYWLLFGSDSLASALPAAAAVGMLGSMTLATATATVQRLIPAAALGRVSAVFATGEAAATLAGALAGPLLARHAGLGGAAAAASGVTLAAAALALALLPPPAGRPARNAPSAAGRPAPAAGRPAPAAGRPARKALPAGRAARKARKEVPRAIAAWRRARAGLRSAAWRARARAAAWSWLSRRPSR